MSLNPHEQRPQEQEPTPEPIKGYYETGQLWSERIENPDGGWTSKRYYETGQLWEELIVSPDGSEAVKKYSETGQLEYEKTTDPAGHTTEWRP